MHCTEKDIQTIIQNVKSELRQLNYKVKKPKEDYLQYQTLRVVKNAYQWLVDFHIKLDRTGNLVNVELTRIEFFSIDKFISDKLKRTNQGNQQRSFLGSIFRFWWIYFIISMVGSLLLGFLPSTGSPLSFVGYVLIGVLGLFFIFYLLSRLIRFYQKKYEIEEADILTEQIKGILKSMNVIEGETSIICWNCFQEVIPVDNKCPACNKELVKV